ILALAKLDHPLFEQRDIGPAAIVTQWIEFGGDPRAEAVFDALTTRFGQDGFDVLYEITAKKGGSRASKKASEILAEPTVRDRMTPALRIALELRDASCESKVNFFERAGREGDERALDLMDRLHSLRCSAARCCYVKNERLETAYKALRTRLGQ